jgi:hypothetical protein
VQRAPTCNSALAQFWAEATDVGDV